MRGKCLIFSAPSGSGKSTIINMLLRHPELRMVFSVSATSRKPRGTERNGVEYLFLSVDEFKQHIDRGDFLEYEEVYEGCYYGTLKGQVEEKLSEGYNVVFDVDVEGGCNIKEYYASDALSIFIQPPSIEELRNRLKSRQTDSLEMIEKRVAKADYELSFAPRFDITIVNDTLQTAYEETLKAVKSFINAE